MATFVDRVVLHVAGGNGGHGVASVNREKFKPLGGPDGGNGGQRGLRDPRGRPAGDHAARLPPHPAPQGRQRQARRGRRAQRRRRRRPRPGRARRHRRQGPRRQGRSPTSSATAPPSSPPAGGRGGLGNAALAPPARKAPGFALLGEPGEATTSSSSSSPSPTSRSSASRAPGKSSLVVGAVGRPAQDRRLPLHDARAQPRAWSQAGSSGYTVADVPGLIPGASEGKGLGLEFLRHVERCSVLVHVLDCATLEPGRDPMTDLEVIEAELAAYAPDDSLGGRPLSERPRVVVLNKIDVPEARDLAEMVAPELEERGLRVFEVVRGQPRGPAGAHLRARATSSPTPGAELAAVRAAERDRHPAQGGRRRGLHRPREAAPTATSSGSLGEKPERWVRQTDFSNDEAVGYLADRLDRLGVEEALLKAGAVAGVDGASSAPRTTPSSSTGSRRCRPAPSCSAARAAPTCASSRSGRSHRGERREEFHARKDARPRPARPLAARAACGPLGVGGRRGLIGCRTPLRACGTPSDLRTPRRRASASSSRSGPPR